MEIKRLGKSGENGIIFPGAGCAFVTIGMRAKRIDASAPILSKHARSRPDSGNIFPTGTLHCLSNHYFHWNAANHVRLFLNANQYITLLNIIFKYCDTCKFSVWYRKLHIVSLFVSSCRIIGSNRICIVNGVKQLCWNIIATYSRIKSGQISCFVPNMLRVPLSGTLEWKTTE